MENKEAAGKILENLRTKFRCVNQIYDLTKEMEQTLSAGDRETLDIVLDMRQKQLDICMAMNEANERILQSLSPGERDHVEGLLKTREVYSVPETPEEEDILSMTKRIKALLIKTMEYDTKISNKIKR